MKVARAWRRLLCRLFGHRLEERTHYVRGGRGVKPGAVHIERCGRCGHLKTASLAHAAQFPFPRAAR